MLQEQQVHVDDDVHILTSVQISLSFVFPLAYFASNLKFLAHSFLL